VPVQHTSESCMQIATTIQEMRALVQTARSARLRVGLVPTMGALHEGHLSLVRTAKAQTDTVVVSIFVNPLQFGPKEDLNKYPRTFEQDCALLEKEGVEFVFAPATSEMYPPGAITYVDVEGLSDRLDGVSRPGHFRGVTTVVAKLFHIVQPDKAFFGQKDAAQSAIIRRMVRDLNFPVEIVVCPIVRESDGLAMSSRNAYLNPEERRQSLVLSRTLQRIVQVFDAGQRDSAELIAAGKESLATVPSLRLDYLSVVDPDTLEAVNEVRPLTLVAVAAWVGSTRLIDNVLLKPR
jgi:pantoate--beta-alanine ligase